MLSASTVILNRRQHIWNRQPSERTFFQVAHFELSMRAADSTVETRIDVMAELANPHLNYRSRLIRACFGEPVLTHTGSPDLDGANAIGAVSAIAVCIKKMPC